MTAITSTSVLATWQLPPVDSRNGGITGFKLYFKRKGVDESPAILHIESPSITTETVTGLYKFTEYEFQVSALTSVGEGTKSSVKTERTQEGGKGSCYSHRIL